MSSRLFRSRVVLSLWCVLFASGAAVRGVTADEAVRPFQVTDSFTRWSDGNADAQAMLDSIQWKPTEFEATWADVSDHDHDRLIRFPSPWPGGNAINDQVALAWYYPEEANGNKPLPAVVVVHESGSGMQAGKAIAEGIRTRGLHALLIHLPHYGERRDKGFKREPTQMLLAMRQGVSDVRRAFDVVRRLPGIDPERVSLQGTSLGGFVAATAGSLDGCYDEVHITLAGGDLYGMMLTGQKDVAKVRNELAGAGFTGEKLRELLQHAEPLRIAHRLDAKRTWMYSALQDEVVPIANCRKLAQTIGLDRTHHNELYAGHYTGVLYLPVILDLLVERVKAGGGERGTVQEAEAGPATGAPESDVNKGRGNGGK